MTQSKTQRHLLMFVPAAMLLFWSGSVSASGQPSEPGTGVSLFERNCAVCHGMNGTGGRGPSLNRPRLQRAPDDTALRALIENGVAPEMPPGWFFSETEIAALAGYVRSLGRSASNPVKGDAVAGERVFHRSGCSACHVISGKGSGYGPELTDIGARRSAAHVIQSIRDPAAALPENFLMVNAKPRHGATVQGVRANEDTFSIQIRDPLGRSFSFWKNDLESLTKLKGATPMPSYADSLSDDELQDLVAYLMTERTAT